MPLPLGGKIRQIMVATESRRGKWDCYSPTMAGKEKFSEHPLANGSSKKHSYGNNFPIRGIAGLEVVFAPS